MKIIFTGILIILISFLFSCSASRQGFKSYDAVRIKESIYKKHLYDTIRVNGELKYRNGSALKGNALRIETYLTKCRSIIKNEKSYLVFKDETKEAPVEKIPIEHIDLIGKKKGIDLDANWFEHYNDPLNPPVLREIPIDTVIIPDCGESPAPPEPKEDYCGCSQFTVSFKCPWKECRDDYYKWYFFEIRGGFASYTDKKPGELGSIGRTELLGEIAAGVRFGSRKQWGIGIAVSSGVPLYNSLETLEMLDLNDGGEPVSIYRPLLLLHGRYTFEETFCLRPFVYGQFGMAVDELSLELAELEFGCKDCKNQIESACINCFDLDLGIPLSYSLGIGVDIPLACIMDISFDFGFRSIAFGEKSPLPIFGFTVPEKRRINMFVFRFGITI